MKAEGLPNLVLFYNAQTIRAVAWPLFQELGEQIGAKEERNQDCDGQFPAAAAWVLTPFVTSLLTVNAFENCLWFPPNSRLTHCFMPLAKGFHLAPARQGCREEEKTLVWCIFLLDAQKYQSYTEPTFRRSSAVEQLTVNQLVVGSIPTAGAIKSHQAQQLGGFFG